MSPAQPEALLAGAQAPAPSGEPGAGAGEEGSSEELERCAQCGTPLDPDQEWCLECGAARTLIHRPPDWRLPLALVGVVVGLILTGLAIALIALSNSANRQAATSLPAVTRTTTATSSTATATAAAPATATASTAATGPSPATETTASAPGLQSWPIGLSGWTVVLAVSPTPTGAQEAAHRLRAAGAGDLGLIEASQHPAMKSAGWVVYSGRFPTQEAATAAASSLVSRGFTRAAPELVGQSGG